MEGLWTRWLLRTWVVLILLFLFIPILLIFLYAFNTSNIQSWPIPGLTLKWLFQVVGSTRTRAERRTPYIIGRHVAAFRPSRTRALNEGGGSDDSFAAGLRRVPVNHLTRVGRAQIRTTCLTPPEPPGRERRAGQTCNHSVPRLGHQFPPAASVAISVPASGSRYQGYPRHRPAHRAKRWPAPRDPRYPGTFGGPGRRGR